MPERRMDTRYYGVPEIERPALERKREREIRELADEELRYGIPFPDKYHAMAKEAIGRVARIMRKHVPERMIPKIDRIFFVPDERMTGEGVVGTHFAPTGTIELRLSELMDLVPGDGRKLWGVLQEKVREGYEQMCRDERDELTRVPAETRMVVALVSTLHADEIGELLWNVPQDVGATRRTLLAAIEERISDARTVEFVRDWIETIVLRTRRSTIMSLSAR